jgi:hypothetical protein
MKCWYQLCMGNSFRNHGQKKLVQNVTIWSLSDETGPGEATIWKNCFQACHSQAKRPKEKFLVHNKDVKNERVEPCVPGGDNVRVCGQDGRCKIWQEFLHFKSKRKQMEYSN